MDPELDGQDTGEQVDNSQGQESTGINPAWNDFLEAIPSQLHSQVTPYLQQWDKNYQEGIGKVHSQYEPYKPFLDQGVDPEQLQYGLQLLEAFNTQPEQVYEMMKQYFGDGQQENEDQTALLEQGQESEPIDITQHPQFQQMSQIVNTMAELLVQQSTQEQEAQADQELEQEFTQAKEKYGDFDEKWVMVQMLSDDNLTLDQAVQQYQQWYKELLTNANRPGPKVLGAGGASPNLGTNPSQLNDKDRKSLVATMLAEAQQNSG